MEISTSGYISFSAIYGCFIAVVVCFLLFLWEKAFVLLKELADERYMEHLQESLSSYPLFITVGVMIGEAVFLPYFTITPPEGVMWWVVAIVYAASWGGTLKLWLYIRGRNRRKKLPVDSM